MNKILIFLTAALMFGCSTLPEQYSASNTRCLVKGVSNGNTSVQIRCVDGGDILWVRGYHLGNKVWLEPGVHKVSVSCSSSWSWGSYMRGADVDITVQSGYTYSLTATPINGPSDLPHVEVTKTERK